MKIAIINKHVQDTLGGSEIQCDIAAKWLAKRGHEPIYIAPGGKNNPASYNTTYPVVPVMQKGSAIADAVLQHKPDIVYWRFNRRCFLRAVRQMADNDIPVIFAISSVNDTLPWAFRPSGGKGIKPVVSALKQSITNRINWEGYRYVQAATSLNPDYVGKIPVPKQIFVPNCIEREQEPFSWPRPFIVWVSNIKPVKQPELFYELARQFRDSGIDFIMIGYMQSGKYDWILEAHEQDDNFYYLGPKTVQEVNGILTQSLFMVHTCQPEGFGNIFLQAWFQQKPTVSYEFDPGGFIVDHRIGCVSGRNFEQLVRDVGFFIENGEERNTHGKRAYDFACKNFSVDKTGAKIEKLMQEILSK